MNRKQAAELFPIIKAFSEGKVIQTSIKGRSWEDLGENIAFYTNDKYRIKPDPAYRPFKDAEECWNEMLKHKPFGWMKSQCNLFLIVHIDDELIGYGNACGNIMHSKFDDILKGFTFADGLPLGVKVEE